MGLINTTSIVKWNGANKSWYISKGYPFTKLNDEFEVNVEHLSKGTKSTVDCYCDGCTKKAEGIRWKIYLSSVDDDGKYYCQSCKAKMRKKSIHVKKAKKKKSYYIKKQKTSFAQWGIDSIFPNFLELYWDYDKNNELDINPWDLTTKTNKKVWIKCQEKDYHESYFVSISNFTARNSRCPYCSGKKVHPKDSLAQYIINILDKDFLNKIWSNKNKKSSFDYTPKSNQKVWWKCLDGEHNDFKRSVYDSSKCDFRCPKCSGNAKKSTEEFKQEVFSLVGDEYLVLGKYSNNKTKISVVHNECGHKYEVSPDRFTQGSRCPQCNESKGEKKIREFLNHCNITFEPQKEFDGLVGVGRGNLSYDFYLSNQNILIEYQGEYHDGTARNQTDDELKIQQEHDNRKRKYAKLNNINLLEIWHWDFNNIEEILKNELNQYEIGGVKK
ncbi:zinc-ribbon domain-containing protein [Bacillus xiapuensis]|uniref:Zinc-ribbon domain-containing protein n=1 Tax=Bacillus xiapuensis TaxID=2014075 RepID=A0ABU6N9V3_9BACI|nr:zinc-ribbon domain-containing protein [Bacillus xiapuensis]